MKFVKGISLFFVLPVVVFCIGIATGVWSSHFFYPGKFEKEEIQEQLTSEEWVEHAQQQTQEQSSLTENYAVEAASSNETLFVDTEYVLEETDMLNHSVVETVSKLPGKYIGMNREQFLVAMEEYETYPPLSELERGFVSLEVLSFSRERVVIQMNYQYVQPSTSFYIAVQDNEVVVLLEDMKTIYINTGILLDSLPEDVQMDVIQMLWIENEESLYNFLENYSS